jgi:hypothetical protein
VPIRSKAIASAGVLIVGLAAAATAASFTISPPGAAVAGRDYPQWLARWWQVRLSVPASGPICQRVGRVVMLIGPTKPNETDRCSITHDQVVYVNGPSSECSTIEPPPSHGDTAAQLRSCARRGFARLSGTHIAIDGRPLQHPGRWTLASGVFRLRLPKHNYLGVAKRSGRSAAYGTGFLLTDLSRGEHVIHQTGNAGPVHLDLTYKIEVAP